MQEELPELLVTDGCIYVAASIDHPGRVRMTSSLLRVVFGVREPEAYRPELDHIALDLRTGGVECVLSDNIRRDALMKFAYVSPQGACGLYYSGRRNAVSGRGTGVLSCFDGGNCASWKSHGRLFSGRLS